MTVCLNVGEVIVAVPVRLPCPIVNPTVLYSPSWSINALTRMSSKN